MIQQNCKLELEDEYLICASDLSGNDIEFIIKVNGKDISRYVAGILVFKKEFVRYLVKLEEKE